MNNPVCPRDKSKMILYASRQSYQCSDCLKEYPMDMDFEQHLAYLEQMETVLLMAVKNGENPVELITNLFIRHLNSDYSDPAHLNGLELKELFELMMSKAQEVK